MKKITIEESRKINGGQIKMVWHPTYWSAICDKCGCEYVALGPLAIGYQAAFNKAYACRIRDTKRQSNG